MAEYSQGEVTTPHMRLPLKFGGMNGGAVVNEQDTSEDIIDCVKAIFAYQTGTRWDMPEFGIPDMLFSMEYNPPLSAVRDALSRLEVRAAIDVTGENVLSDDYLRKLLIEVGLFA